MNRELVMLANRTGASLLPDNDQWKHRMEIRSSSSSRVYIVSQRKSDNTWGCSCPGWKSHRRCKHLNTMVPLLESALKKSTPAIGTA